MEDYTELGPVELQKYVAKVLGWRFVVEDYLITAIDPTGYHHPSDLFKANAWAHVPNWIRDLNACWELFPPGTRLRLEHEPDGIAGYGKMTDRAHVLKLNQVIGEGVAMTPQKALIYAFLAWKKREAEIASER